MIRKSSDKTNQKRQKQEDYEQLMEEEFEHLAVYLLKIVRESIILLTQIVNVEEMQNDNSNVVEIPLNEYFDEYKK